jgi:hypothetical protein
VSKRTSSTFYRSNLPKTRVGPIHRYYVIVYHPEEQSLDGHQHNHLLKIQAGKHITTRDSPKQVAHRILAEIPMMKLADPGRPDFYDFFDFVAIYDEAKKTATMFRGFWEFPVLSRDGTLGDDLEFFVQPAITPVKFATTNAFRVAKWVRDAEIHKIRPATNLDVMTPERYSRSSLAQRRLSAQREVARLAALAPLPPGYVPLRRSTTSSHSSSVAPRRSSRLNM